MLLRKLLQRTLVCLLYTTLLLPTALGQTKTISGKVTDARDGTPLLGASVVPKGAGKGVTTNETGSFRITVPESVTTLVISSVGYGSREVAASGEDIAVTLTASNQSLNEVVVVGYGTQRKKDLTGSVTVISSKDFNKGIVTTPEQLIQGKVAGVQITSNSGAPGAGSTIRIRGGASLNASNDPLIVIDGVPLDNSAIPGAANPLSLINPNDIESFNVLKDAAATAIYGSRASNGVIIITTKKGRQGKPVINFSTQLSAAQRTGEVAVLSAQQYRNLINAKGNDVQKALLGKANTDWQKEIYQTALAQDNNISISGALNKLPYRLSAGFLNQDGMLRTGNLKRTSAAVNLSPKFFKDYLKVDLNVRGAVSKNRFADEGAIGSAVIFDPTQPVNSASKRYGGFFEWLDPSTGLPNVNAPRNPVGLLEQRVDKSTVQRSIGNIQLDYKFHFLPDLHANVNAGYDISKGEGNRFIPDSAASQYAQKGLNKQYSEKRTNSLFEAYLNYAKELASIDSRIELLAGYSYQDYLTTKTNFADLTARGDTITSTKPAYPMDKPRNTLLSYYGRLNYSFKSRYLLTASLRRDGSSRFSPDNRWGLFPAAALAWNMKEESFLRNADKIAALKLRASYGVTGQQDGIGNYDYISYYVLSSTSAQYQLGDTLYNMYRPGGYYANRKWEQTETYNAGLDFGFFNNRISGSVDVYYKKTKDLLNEITQPAGTNFANRIVANVGSMENRGVELSINAQPVRNKDLSWDVNFNITYNKNKITNLTIAPDPEYPGNQFTSINGGTGNYIQINSVNYPRASFYVYKQVYGSDGKPIENLFVDKNSDGFINEKDLYQYKNADPKVFMGLSSSVTYKKWNAGFVMRANIGNYVYNNVYSNLGRYNIATGLPNLLNNVSANYLETGFAGGNVRQLMSDYYVQNASFLRMDNITVGFNAGKIGTSHLVGLRISASVQNVFVVTRYKGLDPEISSGVDNNFYPRPRTFVLGLGLDF